MKFLAQLATVVVSLSLVACATQRDAAEGSFDYVDLEPVPTLIVPPEFTQVPQRPKFMIPVVNEESIPANARVGSAVSVRAPRQVMPMVEGSRIDETSQQAKIWFDAVDEMNNIGDWVWREVTDLVAQQYQTDMTETELSETQRVLETDIFTLSHGSQARPGFINRLRNRRMPFTSEQRLKITMEAPTHGRSASLEVVADDITYKLDGTPQTEPQWLRRELENGLLNSVSRRLQQNYQQERVAQARATRALRHAEKPDGTPAYALDVDFNTGWVSLPGVFDFLDFEVEDLNQVEGLYYVNYQPGGRVGFFGRLAFWRDNSTGPLGLERGSGYQFEVEEINGVFYIVIRQDDEQLSEQQLDAMFPMFAEAFSDHSDD